MSKEPEHVPGSNHEVEDDGRRPSGITINITIIYFILLVIGTATSLPVAMAIIGFIFIWLLWSTFSNSEFEKMKRTYPGYSRSEYIVKGVIFDLLAPPILIATIAGILLIIDRLAS